MTTSELVRCTNCGALRIKGKKCEFCNTEFPEEEGIVSSDASISITLPTKKTVAQDEYIRRINRLGSFDNYISNVAVTYEGSYCGVIDRNANLLIPADYDEIQIIGPYVFLLSDDKWSVFYINKWKFLADKDGEKLIVDSPYCHHQDAFSLLDTTNYMVCTSGQLAFKKDGYFYIYNHLMDKCIKINDPKMEDMYPFGKGFASFSGTGEVFHPTFNGYVCGDGTYLRHNYFRYNIRLSKIEWCPDSDCDEVATFPFNEKSDPKPQLKKIFEFIDEQITIAENKEKSEKRLKTILIAIGVVAIIAAVIAVFF